MSITGIRDLVDATGTRRRLQALSALGWTSREIAAQVGADHKLILEWMHTDRTVLRTTAARVAAAFDVMCMTIPTDTRRGDHGRRNRIRALAAARGWVPPLAWDDIDDDSAPASVDREEFVDEIAIELAVNGYQVHLTRQERHIAVTTLNRDRGLSDGVIAKMLSVNEKTIERDRRHLGLPPAVGADGERLAS